MVRRTLAVVAIVLLVVAIASPVSSQGIPELLDKIKPSVVFVLASGDQTASGTAFVVADRLLITALHVVDEAQTISIVLPDGTTQPADVVAADLDKDLAVLRISKSGLPILTLGDSNGVKLGEEVIVVGYPLPSALGRQDVTVTRGIVSALRTQTEEIQVDAAMNPGVSGGPVLNGRGEVIGVAIAFLRRAQNVNFASPANSAQALVAGVLSNPDRPPLSLPLTTVTSLLMDYSSGGIGGGGHQRHLGVTCIEPPPRAKRLIKIQAELRAPDALSVATWLSVDAGAEANDAKAFALLNGIGDSRARGMMDNVDLKPVTLCLNYEAWNNARLLPIGLTFNVKYTFYYKTSTFSSAP